MKRRSEATIEVTLDVPARPTETWDVQCPHCYSTDIRCWNFEQQENYPIGYRHKARQHALEGAQEMWHQMMGALAETIDNTEQEEAA